MEPSKKVVEIEGLGLVEFPAGMSDSDIQLVIRANVTTPTPEGEALETPWLDPTLAATGGLTGGIKAGVGVLGKLTGGLIGTVTGAAVEYPIGQTADIIAKEHPWAALGFSVLAGFLSGATLESAIQKKVQLAFSKSGRVAGEKEIHLAAEGIKRLLDRKEVQQADAVIDAITKKTDFTVQNAPTVGPTGARAPWLEPSGWPGAGPPALRPSVPSGEPFRLGPLRQPPKLLQHNVITVPPTGPSQIVPRGGFTEVLGPKVKPPLVPELNAAPGTVTKVTPSGKFVITKWEDVPIDANFFYKGRLFKKINENAGKLGKEGTGLTQDMFKGQKVAIKEPGASLKPWPKVVKKPKPESYPGISAEELKSFREVANYTEDYIQSISKRRVSPELSPLEQLDTNIPTQKKILGKQYTKWRKAQKGLESSNDDIAERAQETIDDIEGNLDSEDIDKLYEVASKVATKPKPRPEHLMHPKPPAVGPKGLPVVELSKEEFEKEVLRSRKQGVIDTGSEPDIELHAGLPIHRIIPQKWRAAWQEFWLPTSTMPGSKRYLLQRGKTFGGIGTEEVRVGKIAVKLATFDLETRKDIFRFMDGKIALSDLPDDVQHTAITLRRISEIVGRQLLKRGLISEDDFNRLKGRYIHYIYAKHIIGEGHPIGITPTGKLDLSYTLERTQLTPVQKANLGLINDAGVAVPVGLGKALTDIRKYDFLATVDSNPEWVFQGSKVQIPGYGTLSIGELAEEVTAYSKTVKKLPTSEVIDTYLKLKMSLEKALAGMEGMPKDFIQMPVDKRYGPLSGAFVRKPIADDIRPLWSPLTAGFTAKGYGGVLQSLWRVEQESMALFKTTKVALNAPSGVKNVISNVIQNNMRGRALAYIPGDYIQALKAMKGKDKFFVEAKTYGLFRTNWAVSEINEVLTHFEGFHRQGWQAFLYNIRRLAKYYGKIDDISKLAIYHQLRRDGMEIGDAVLEAQRWGMDYSLANRSVRELRRHAVPFISYQYKVAPLIYDSLTKRPWVIGKYLALPLGVAYATKELYDITEEEWDRLQKDLPLHIKKTSSYMILPFKDPDGRWQWVNVEYFFPWGNWMGILRGAKNLDIKPITSIFGGPLLDIAATFKTAAIGKSPVDSFTGRPIYEILDPPRNKVLKTLEWLYGHWAPSMLTRHGALGETVGAIRGERDRWGRLQTPEQAVGKWLGVNIESISRKQAVATKKARLNELQRELFRVLSDPSRTATEKSVAKQQFQERLKDIREGR